MSRFLVEIPVPQADRVDVERAELALQAAQSRLSASAVALRTLVAGVTIEDAHLVCLIEAEAIEVVRSLVALAFLPPARIRELLPSQGWP